MYIDPRRDTRPIRTVDSDKGVTFDLMQTQADALRAALEWLTDATTEDFANGGDRAIRRQLVEALGYSWTEYDCGNGLVRP